jgi:hypothetical protein
MVAVNFGQNYQNKVQIQPLSKVVNFTNHVVNTKYRVNVDNFVNPFSRNTNRFSYVPQVQDLREEKVDLDEVEDITSESKLESMLETAKDYDDRKKIRSSLRNMKKKRHDAQLKKTTESKKKEDENLVKSAGGQTKPQETKEFTTMQQQAAPAPVSASQNSRKEQKYTRSVTMDATMINRGNGVVQKQYANGNGMSGSISGMQSANPPTTPGGSYAKPTFGSNQFTSGSRASSGERKGGANFQVGSQRSSPVENQQTNLFKKNTTSTTTTNTVSSSSNKFQSAQSLLKQQSESTATSSSSSSSQSQSTSNASKLARNKSMPASSLSKKEQFLAKLEQNADPNRGVGGGGSSFKNARSAFNGPGSSSGSVKRGSSFVVPNATGVKQLLLRWCQQRTNGYDHVEVTNFSSSWASGMAFCALIHSFFPESFNYEELSPANRAHNFELAFSAAERLCQADQLIDVEDMIIMGNKPDSRCIFCYVQSLYNHLRRFESEESKQEMAKLAGRRGTIT